ncbi:MAG: TfoX/Sxy family DNA transformation protein [Bacteroidota bacterium]
MNDLDTIKNFGPYMVKIMNLIGIHSRDNLMASDYKTIKKNLIKAGVTPHLNIFYSIEMGLQGKSWNEITANEKNEIQKILKDA